MSNLKLNKYICCCLIVIFGAITGFNGVFALNANLMSAEKTTINTNNAIGTPTSSPNALNPSATNSIVNSSATTAPSITVSPTATTSIYGVTASPSATGATVRRSSRNRRLANRTANPALSHIGTTFTTTTSSKSTVTATISPVFTARPATARLRSADNGATDGKGIGNNETVASINVTVIDKGDFKKVLASHTNYEKIGALTTIEAPQIPGWKADSGESNARTTLSVSPQENNVTFYYVRDVNFTISDAGFNTIEVLRNRVQSAQGISRQEAALELYKLVPSSYKISDVDYKFLDVNTSEDTAYTRAIEFLAGYGIIEGYQDSAFKPTEKITLKEFNDMVDRLAVRSHKK